ncbi:MAG: hypothetical protein WBP26_05910 [Candidatus Saccharimonadales bacterium]
MHTTGENLAGTEAAFPRGVIDVTQLETEWQAQERAEAIRQRAGAVALAFEVAKKPEKSYSKYATMLDGLLGGREGDKDGLDLTLTNVQTDITERLLKAGGETEVIMNVAQDDSLFQYGQDMDDVQESSYRWAASSPIMYLRTNAEGRNGQRLKNTNRDGYLQDNYYFTASPCDDTAKSDAELQDRGFFAKTKSASLQFTTNDEHGNLVMNTVFVAGVKDEQSPRHDLQAIADVVFMLSGGTINWYGKSALEMLDTPLLIPKKLLPNGSIDFVKMYDEYAGGTFYGKDQPVQDYGAYRAQNKEFMRQYENLSRSIVQRLIAEAPTFADPGEATARLGKLVGEAMARRAVEDMRIDPYVFGVAAAQDIILGRYEMQMGNYTAAQHFANNAAKKEQSVGCPSADKARKSQDDNLQGGGGNNESEDEKDSGDSKLTWKWKTGICRVESCSTRPGQTRVGPCDVCQRCQHEFDRGGDPTTYSARKSEASEATESPVDIFVQLFHDINARSVAAEAEARRIVEVAFAQEEAKKQLVTTGS